MSIIHDNGTKFAVVATNQRAMTIVHICSGDLWAGAEQMIYALLAGLRQQQRHNLLVILMTHGTLSRKLTEIGVENYVIDESIYSLPRIIGRAYQLLRKRNVELIHAHRHKENVVGGILGKLLGVRALMSTVHGLPEPTSDKVGCMPRLKEELNRYVLRNWYSCMVAVSFDLERQLREIGKFDGCNIAVVHNGVSSTVSLIHERSAEQKLQIGTAGRLVEVKDFNLFIDVAAGVLQEVSNVRFRILGDGPLKQRLTEQVRELGLLDTIVFEGYREDAHAFYDEIDIYLNTSIHEGLPLSILEAMAKGRPVVAPMVGGIPEIIVNGQDGFLIKSRDRKEFAAKCLLLVRDRQLMDAMGKNAQRKIQDKFSSARMVQAYGELYEIYSELPPISQTPP